jgi:predicted ATP-grasp superfamily ATP-dependent carboligase
MDAGQDPASLIEASAAQFPDRMAAQAIVEAISLEVGTSLVSVICGRR